MHALDLAAALSDYSGLLRGGLRRLPVLAEDECRQTDYGRAAPVAAFSACRLYRRVIALRTSPARIALLQHTVSMRRSHGIHPAGSSFGRHTNGVYLV